MGVLVIVASILQGTTVMTATYGFAIAMLIWIWFGCVVLIHRQRDYLTRVLYLALMVTNLTFWFNPLTIRHVATNLLAP